jgi:hypothetical protein
MGQGTLLYSLQNLFFALGMGRRLQVTGFTDKETNLLAL